MLNSLSKPGIVLLSIKSQKRFFQMNQLELHRRNNNTAPHLQLGDWFPANHCVLNDWLGDLQNHPDRHSMVAVFDFDNTCTYRDVGNAVFRFQLAGLCFRLPPDQLGKIFSDRNRGSTEDNPFAAAERRILSLYEILWPFIGGDKLQEKSLFAAEHNEFKDLFFWYCREARGANSSGPLYTLPLMSRLLAGYTTDEVEHLTIQALISAQQEHIAVESRSMVTHYDSLNTITPIEIATGLQVHCEIIDLMGQLQRCGIRSCIVSASTEWVVKAAVKHLGFPVAQEDIFGIRVQLGGDVLTTTLEVNYPITYRTGKVKVINEIICATPIMIAGDAITDYEMLNIPDVPMRLIINHNKSGLISTLYDDPRFLLQGLNTVTGTFRSHRETCAVYDEQVRKSFNMSSM